MSFLSKSFSSGSGKSASTSSESTSEPVAMSFHAGAKDRKIPIISGDNIALHDIASSEKFDSDKPITCGFYRVDKGAPFTYTYTYHEMKIVVEGEFDISDETGQKVHAVAGDVFYFPKGSKITFTSETYGLAFFTGQRFEGQL
ncbi:hypothetical protein BT96DRAFT_963240 [Gymnopus androsaceus JB14]|uniref:Ethanolamine utilization protein n=1 Tax=Gymnopus androsaceus JB14 TaxID=1447944 RepID=A0A6A4IBA3_9AGAR|nr:hypothetical protein BT96DRAFT_963240 [Gymnopus androsaceus JB14]